MNTSANRRGDRVNLTNLVEQYLLDNSQKTYVDIDDMINELQTKSFKFARMKRNAFAHMVKNAYHSYCRAQAGEIGQEAEIDLEPEHRFDSDSDIEEINDPEPRPVLNNLMTNFYNTKPSSSSSSAPHDKNVNSTPDRFPPPGGGSGGGGGFTPNTPQHRRNSTFIHKGNSSGSGVKLGKAYPVPTLPTNSGGGGGGGVKSGSGGGGGEEKERGSKTTPSAKDKDKNEKETKKIAAKEVDDDDDDDDLEIIEEVKRTPTSTNQNSSQNSSNSNVNPSSNSNSSLRSRRAANASVMQDYAKKSTSQNSNTNSNTLVSDKDTTIAKNSSNLQNSQNSENKDKNMTSTLAQDKNSVNSVDGSEKTSNLSSEKSSNVPNNDKNVTQLIEIDISENENENIEKIAPPAPSISTEFQPSSGDNKNKEGEELELLYEDMIEKPEDIGKNRQNEIEKEKGKGTENGSPKKSENEDKNPSSSSPTSYFIKKPSRKYFPNRSEDELESESVPHKKQKSKNENNAKNSGKDDLIFIRAQKRKNSDIAELTPKRPKKEIGIISKSEVSFCDFGGSEKILDEIRKLLLHLKHPEMYKKLGVVPPRGFLLHGPPGCGKTLLAQAIAGELKLPLLKIGGTEIVSGISGESENNIRSLFEQALSIAPSIIFIDEIDSIVPKRETAEKEMGRRIVAQMLSCIDNLGTKVKGDQVLLIGATNRIDVIDIGLRRAGRFDREICLGIPDESAREKILRIICRGIRLEDEFDFGALAKFTPGYVGADLQALVREAAVEAISTLLEAPTLNSSQTQKITENGAENNEEKEKIIENESNDDNKNNKNENENECQMEIEVIDDIVNNIEKNEKASLSPSKIIEISQNSNNICVNATNILNTSNFNKNPENIKISQLKNDDKWLQQLSPLSESELENLRLKMSNFKSALKVVVPSAKREGFGTVPDTTWDDIGALKEIRDELQVCILGPVKYSYAFQALGLQSPSGVLLCGPPGCGKTLLAKAVANEAGINFISVKGPELLNMYVGESERAVRQCFQRAKNSSPCVIFFDELDSLCPRRSDGHDSGSSVRVVNQLLTEMDGMESRVGVFVMAATNRPDIIDPAILRPGRLDKILFVNLPTKEERVDILRAITRSGTKPLLSPDVDLTEVGERAEFYSGADLASLVREAGISAFRELVLSQSQNSKDQEFRVEKRHFESALLRTKPSVSPKDRIHYERMKELHSIISG